MSSQGSVSPDQSFLDEVVEVVTNKTLELSTILHRLGLDVETRNTWKATFKNQISETCSDMVEEALNVQNRIVESIEQLLKKSENLCKQLHIKMPSYGSDVLSLCEEKKRLQKQIEEYEVIIEARRKEISDLKKQELELCRSLGREPRLTSDSSVMTPEKISEFSKYVESLEGEKFKREEKYLELKCEILDLVAELKIKPSLDLEKAVVASDDSLFLVTDFNMKWVQDYHQSLTTQKREIGLEIAALREKVRGLWEMLSEDIKTCDEFLKRHTGNSTETLEALKREVKRCEDVKKANIQKFIEKLKEELHQLWEQCHYTSCQRAEFYYFDDTLYTEDLMSLFELEITKMNKHYSENKEIFTLLEQRHQSWTKMIELEERSSAPDRFKNRGGQLLKEERERNVLLKKIPEVEEKLMQLGKSYEARTGQQFLSWGNTIEEIIAKSHSTRETEKKQKLSARKQQREMTLTPGKSGLNLAVSVRKNLLTPSATSTSKRKFDTPLYSDGKRKKVQNRGAKTTDMPTIKLNDRTITRSRFSAERKSRLKRVRRISRQLEGKRHKETHSDSTNYDSFEIRPLDVISSEEGWCSASPTPVPNLPCLSIPGDCETMLRRHTYPDSKEVTSKETCRSTLFKFQDSGSSSSPTLAIALPATPKMLNTPRTPRRNRYTPKTALKAKHAGGLMLDF